MNSETNRPLATTNAALPTSEQPPSPPASSTRRIFLGPEGLRAGWSLLIFFVLVAGVLLCVQFVATKIYPPPPKGSHHPTEVGVGFMLLNEGVPFLVVLLVSWIMSKIERRPNSVYGLGGERKLKLVLAGMAWGIVCLSLLVLILWKSGWLVFEGRLLFGPAVLGYGAVWLFGFFLVGLLEEYLTRGYMQYTLTRGLAGLYRSVFKARYSEALGFWTAAAFFSILFGLGHSGNPGESPIGLLSAGLAGFVFCFSLWWTGSLWWAIGLHATWDWGQSFLYGVADSGMLVQHRLLATHPAGKPILSGGTTGPEGSVFVLAILALIAVIVVTTLPRRRQHYLWTRNERTAG